MQAGLTKLSIDIVFSFLPPSPCTAIKFDNLHPSLQSIVWRKDFPFLRTGQGHNEEWEASKTDLAVVPLHGLLLVLPPPPSRHRGRALRPDGSTRAELCSRTGRGRAPRPDEARRSRRARLLPGVPLEASRRSAPARGGQGAGGRARAGSSDGERRALAKDGHRFSRDGE